MVMNHALHCLYHTLNCFKKGLDLAVQSFVMLYHHPLLCIYHTAAILMFAVISTISCRLTNYSNMVLENAQLQLVSHEQLHSAFFQNDYVLLLMLLCMSFFSIFLRTFFDTALVKHSYKLIKKEPISVKAVLYAIRKRIVIILQWALLVNLVTIAIYSISLLTNNEQAILTLTVIVSLFWSLSTFFILPIITLERTTLWQAIHKSITYMRKVVIKVCGGIFWISLLFLVAGFLSIALLALPSVGGVVMLIGSFITDIILTSATLIFKTKMYTTMQKEARSNKQPKQSDYAPL